MPRDYDLLPDFSLSDMLDDLARTCDDRHPRRGFAWSDAHVRAVRQAYAPVRITREEPTDAR